MNHAIYATNAPRTDQKTGNIVPRAIVISKTWPVFSFTLKCHHKAIPRVRHIIVAVGVPPRWMETNRDNRTCVETDSVTHVKCSCPKIMYVTWKPFAHCITIASACNFVFRKLFLEERSICIIPPQGYRPIDKQSVKAMQWIKYHAHHTKVEIQHVGYVGEKKVGPYKVDGYCEIGN